MQALASEKDNILTIIHELFTEWETLVKTGIFVRFWGRWRSLPREVAQEFLRTHWEFVVLKA
jgi:hypothetical protein